MKWQKFDKKVNNELSGHQSEVDIDALWGAIEPEVDAINAEKKKRRRGVFWWFFGGLLLLSMIAIGLFLSENDALDVAHLDTQNQTVEKPVIADFDKNKTAISTEDAVNDIAEKEAAAANLNRENTLSDIQQKRLSKPVIFEKSENFNAEKLGKNTILDKNADLSQNKSTAWEERTFNEKSTIFIAENQLDLKEKVEQKTVETRNSIIVGNSKLSVEHKNQLFLMPAISINNIEGTTSDLKRMTLSQDEKRAIEKDVREAIAEAKKCAKKKFDVAVSFYGGVSLANRSLSSNGDSATTELVQLRQDTEQNLETLQLGAQFNWQHKQTGLALTSGINYTQINEKFEYRNNQVTVDSIQGIESFYRNVNGDTIAIMGMIPQTTTATIHKRYYNNYRLIDVPVLIGYRKQFGDFSIGAQAGVFVNLTLQTSGRFFANETDDIDIDEADIFKTNVGLSYYVGATIDYHLNEKWTVFAAPNIRYFPNSFSKTNYGISQKYSLYGVNLGLQYSF